ncbi:MAG: lipid II flippase MurJ, partial [Clostridia bacterium]|nr:lipid II flippase MurJ [Clostridia bacterium]
MLGKSYILVVVGILLAKGLGFFRDMAFAGVFGTGTEADIYSQVFGLVNLIFTGIGVALSTLVIKNLNKEENAGHEQSYAASFLRKSILALTVAAFAVALLARPIVNMVLPGLSPEEFELAVKMMYLMAPSLIFVVVAYIVSGLLQNKQVYFITSIMSLPFNVAIIAALFFENVDIMAVALVTTIGWFFHIVIQLPAFYKKGYSFFEKKDKSLIKKEKSPEILWIFISNMMFQLCVYIDRAFVGDASTFNYASNLFITISSVFVVAMSTVVFPSISKNYEEGQITYVNELVQYIITIMVAIFLPFLLVVGFFGEDVIRLVYERGEFAAESTIAVSKMFFIYSLGVLGYVAQELFNKVLYLAGKYKYTVIGTIVVVLANVGINLGIKASPLSENPELTSV